MAEQQEDIDSLKRSGRRRLVGAVALVLAAVIVLPMVFDPAPKSSAPPVAVRIPGEDDTPFKPKLPVKAEAAKPQAPKAEAPRLEKAPEGAGEQFFVQVGAFANPQPVIAKLAEAKVPYYTEEIAVKSGRVTRVRAGPFATRGAAESAAGKLKTLGLPAGSVSSKSG
ncbi:MAG: SPOR domain-containing protein [Betaproteobacteria bacterium]